MADLHESLAWLSGACLALLPSWAVWRGGSGAFGTNLLYGVLFSFAGGALAVLLWRARDRIANAGPLSSHAVAAALVAAIACSIFVFADWAPFTPGWHIALGLTAAAGVFKNSACQRRLPPGHDRRIGNTSFWIALLILLIGFDFYVLRQVAGGPLDHLMLAFGRVMTQIAVVCGLAMLFIWLRRLTPAPWHSLLLLVVAMIPAITLTNLAMRLVWNQSLEIFLNSLSAAGTFDFNRDAGGAGIAVSLWQASLLAALVAAASLGVWWLLARISARTSWHPSIKTLAGIGLTAWGLTIAESAAGVRLKSPSSRLAEIQHFALRIGFFDATTGIAKFRAQFRPAPTEYVHSRALSSVTPLATKPDIFIFMVESLRSDAITPETMPFLHEFSRAECQPFGRTFAASNCTPLSWFGLMHSLPPVHWQGAVTLAEHEGRFPGAYPLRLLRRAGYAVEFRSVFDMSYQHIFATTLGTGAELATFADMDQGRSRDLPLPEREKIMLHEIITSVRNSPAGGRLRIASIDCTHYHYHWPEDFKPPHPDYAAANDYGGLSPSPAQIRRMKNRYLNAAAWLDEMMRQFITFMRRSGRLDDAIIIITGDHGEEFQEHGSWFHCSGLVREQTEVPILIKWPKNASAPPRDVVSHLDVMPTLLHHLGFAPAVIGPLAGKNLFLEASGDAMVTTGWAGLSGISMIFANERGKIRLAWDAPWLHRMPGAMEMRDWVSHQDKPMTFKEKPAELLRREFQPLIERHFSRFQEFETAKLRQ